MVMALRPWKRPLEDHDVGTPGGLAGQLHSSLGGLGPGVGEEEGVDSLGGDLGQPVGQGGQAVVAVHVDLGVQEPGRLFLHGGHHPGMAVSGGGHRDSAGEVEVLGAVCGGDGATRPRHHLQVGHLEPHVGQPARSATPSGTRSATPSAARSAARSATHSATRSAQGDTSWTAPSATGICWVMQCTPPPP